MVEETVKQKSKKDKKPYIFAVGRRREAVARARLYENIKTGVVLGDTIVKKGEVYVNGKPIQQIFSSKIDQLMYQEPLRVTNALNRYAITIRVDGGGTTGQLKAVVFALARALEKVNKEEFRPILKKRGFLTADSRIRQRRKVGMGGKSRRKRQSPKR